MKRYTVNLTAEARTDLDEISDYIVFTIQAPDASTKIIDKILDKCERLSIFPKGATVRKKVRGEDLRFLHAGKYLVSYSIDEAKSEVTIRNIIYAKKDIVAALK